MSHQFQLTRTRWPLWLQLTSALLVVLLLVNFIAASLIRYIISDFELKRAEKNNRDSFSFFAASIIDTVISEDVDILNIIAKQSLENSPSILALSIENEKGQLLGNYSQSHSVIKNDIRYYSYAIKREGKKLGTINVTWDASHIQTIVNQHVTEVQLLIFIMLIVLSCLIAIFIHWLIIHPISRITRYLVTLSENKQRPFLKISFISRDLEFLAISANQLSVMVKQCEQREQELLLTRKKLQMAHDEALRANQAKSSFLATMSHEIRTPLNAVLGVLCLLKNTDLDRKQLQLVHTGQGSGELLLTIINDTLDFSKMEADKLHLKNTRFNLHRLLANSIELLQSQANQKMLAIILFLEPELPCYAKGDPDRLCQILINLINNAIKFTANGRITIKASATSIDDKKFVLHCSIQDTGIGIAKDFQISLFEKFTMADQSHSKNQKGTGLGLAICKRLVTLMQGNISVDSKLGTGSTFMFTVNLEIANEYKYETDTIEKEARQLPATNTRILLAEDNLANQMVIKNILEYAGLQVDIVTNGHEAIDAVRNSSYDIVLMDISMPDMDGMSAARNIRQLPGSTGKLPIIALTAHSLPKDRERFIKAGMDDYLAKPIDRATTLHCIARWTKNSTTEKSQNNAIMNKTNIAYIDTIDSHINPIINMSILKQLSKNTSPGIILELLMLYIKDARKRIKKIQIAITQSDFKTLEFEIHALSNSAITYGNLKLHTLAKKIEQLCQQGDYEKMLTCAIPLPTIANESFRSIENYISEIKGDSGSP